MRKILNIGAIANDGTGDKLRHAFDLSQQNFVELYSFFGDGQNITSLSVRQKLDTPTNSEVDQKVSTAIKPTSDHIANKSNPHSVTKAQVGLSNVDNTSDANKPISTETQKALDLKADNTDISQQLSLKEDKTNKGVANGYASLDENKKVPVTQLPFNILDYCPIAYPKSTPPTGYLVLMGQAISASVYPILYSLYGATLPDMRAYTIRGLDSERGIDVGRIILSEQGDAIRNITGTWQNGDYWNMPNAIGTGAVAKAQNGWSAPTQGSRTLGDGGFTFDASRVVPVASENRIKNIAFLYIVKAG